MLRTKVKAGAVNNLTDARYFAAREVSWMGFCLDPSSDRYLQPQVMQAIREWIDGPLVVGEFDLAEASDIARAIEMLELDAVQVGMFTDTTTLIELQSPVPVFKEIIIEPDTAERDILELFEAFAPLARFFVLNLDKNGLSWAQLKGGEALLSLPGLQVICQHYPVLLSIGLDQGDIAEILDQLPLAGLEFRGGEEERVGVKSFEAIDSLFDALEE